MSRPVYGPVPSRRLGRSLGIDLIPFKTCSYNCIYCQLGRTRHKTVERRNWIAPEIVLEELKKRLHIPFDTITLAGSGEPTLHSEIGRVIADVKMLTDAPVAVLTNGSLLSRPDVRRDLEAADIVLPSLDAGNEKLFHYINRPHPAVRFLPMVEGLIDFRRSFRGKIWLEVFLLGGVNALPPAVHEIALIAERIGPERIQLNTVTRPPAEPFAMQVSQDIMEQLAEIFGGRAEIIADYRQPPEAARDEQGEEEVKELILRRPCTLEDISSALSMDLTRASRFIAELTARGEVESTAVGSKRYFTAVR